MLSKTGLIARLNVEEEPESEQDNATTLHLTTVVKTAEEITLKLKHVTRTYAQVVLFICSSKVWILEN